MARFDNFERDTTSFKTLTDSEALGLILCYLTHLNRIH